MQFLIGLDECYTNIRGQILFMQPLPTAAKAYGMLRQEEKQRVAHKQQISTPIAPEHLQTKLHSEEQSTTTKHLSSKHSS